MPVLKMASAALSALGVCATGVLGSAYRECKRCLHVPGTDADDNAGDHNYLVLAKPNVIMNDIRLRGLAVARTEAAGRNRRGLLMASLAYR
jgi:hypothetical protein